MYVLWGSRSSPLIWPPLFPGSAECVRLLIDVGANLEAHDCHFGTPLHVACAREHLDCVKILLNAGVETVYCLFIYIPPYPITFGWVVCLK